MELSGVGSGRRAATGGFDRVPQYRASTARGLDPGRHEQARPVLINAASRLLVSYQVASTAISEGRRQRDQKRFLCGR